MATGMLAFALKTRYGGRHVGNVKMSSVTKMAPGERIAFQTGRDCVRTGSGRLNDGIVGSFGFSIKNFGIATI
jgi:hypothetical protein